MYICSRRHFEGHKVYICIPHTYHHPSYHVASTIQIFSAIFFFFNDKPRQSVSLIGEPLFDHLESLLYFFYYSCIGSELCTCSNGLFYIFSKYYFHLDSAPMFVKYNHYIIHNVYYPLENMSGTIYDAYHVYHVIYIVELFYIDVSLCSNKSLHLG